MQKLISTAGASSRTGSSGICRPVVLTLRGRSAANNFDPEHHRCRSFRGFRIRSAGGSAGIGRAVALTLAENGVMVTIMARRQERLDAVVSKMKTKVAFTTQNEPVAKGHLQQLICHFCGDHARRQDRLNVVVASVKTNARSSSEDVDANMLPDNMKRTSLPCVAVQPTAMRIQQAHACALVTGRQPGS